MNWGGFGCHAKNATPPGHTPHLRAEKEGSLSPRLPGHVIRHLHHHRQTHNKPAWKQLIGSVILFPIPVSHCTYQVGSYFFSSPLSSKLPLNLTERRRLLSRSALRDPGSFKWRSKTSAAAVREPTAQPSSRGSTPQLISVYGSGRTAKSTPQEPTLRAADITA